MNLAALRRSPVCAVLVVLSVLPFSLDAACVGPPDVGFALSVPSTLSANTAWFEIGAFAGGVCPNATQLAGGIPLLGPVARVVFGAGDAAPPAFGDLPKGSYGFAAVARAADCSVIGQGCSVIDVGGTSGISIAVSPIASPAGACEQGSECIDAVCLPEGDASAGSGSGCSLAFVGAGPLADPLGVDSTLLSPPAIVATDTGFLLAYREFDPNVGSARLTLIPIDDRGAASVPQRIALRNRCIASPESDGTALGWSGSSGVVAASRRACPMSGPGVDVFTVDARGASTGGTFTSTGSDGVILSKGHALASSPSGVLLANIDARTRVATVTPVNGTTLGSSTFPFGDVADAVGAYVTVTSMGTGLLSLGSATAGSDAGSDATTDAAPIVAEAGSTLETASFTSVGSGAKLSSLPAANDFQASWLSLSGVDSRILVATNGTPTSKPIAWYAFDVGVIGPAHVDSFAPQVAGNVVYADVALHGDNAFFAAEVGTSISLFAFRKASTIPELLVENDFANDERIPIASLQDGLIAVAADATRVAVVWGTARNVSSAQDLGGYAVVACVPSP